MNHEVIEGSFVNLNEALIADHRNRRRNIFVKNFVKGAAIGLAAGVVIGAIGEVIKNRMEQEETEEEN